MGYELPIESYKGKQVYLVLSKNYTASREYKKFDNPPVSYSDYYGGKNELTVDDFDESGDYILMKILKQ